MRRRWHIGVGLLLVALLFASAAHAQISGNSQPDPLRFVLTPETPGPGDKVTIEVQGIGSFLGNSIITWKQNGKQVKTGTGATTYSFVAGGVGSATQIDVIVESSQGTYTNSFVFAPSVVEMLWEAETSAPLFYAGKPLYSAGSRLRVIAYPEIAVGKSLATFNKLSFQWSLNGDKVPDQSGLGKNVLLIDGNMLHQSETASLDIFIGNNKVAHGQITIPATDPQVLLYNKDPLRGEILDYALPNTFALGSKEITMQAEPYYFSNLSKAAGQLSYSWTLNGNDTSGPDSAQGLLTLRQTGQGSGAATIGVVIQNVSGVSLVQEARTALNILFGTSQSSSLFGL